MDNKIKDLELEIKVLKQRINILETKEKNKKIFKIIKYIIIIVVLLLLLIYGYKFYNDFLKTYKEIKNIVNNSLKIGINS